MSKQARSIVKSSVAKLSQDELLSLIAELYRLSKSNQVILPACFADAEAVMKDCKEIIAGCRCLDTFRHRPLQVAKVRKAVADCCKAVTDTVAHFDPMQLFLEQGNAFAVEYGGIDAGFYIALLTKGRHPSQAIYSLPQ